ncbi:MULTISPECIES: hypothetical protein [Blautia]|jgi:hypothetical protein|uniref:Uncharacterized protein n=2 Tax=Blautia producta TaxID=33035 RepID=A0A7G5N173_9FIRM|nr:MULTISPECIES: hypothetical protein [Blautia]MCQ4743238.1 hypothetical protein [Blautia producta]QIB56612.1 hypothetical protein GXM18_18240 [Blautia producta ATCC 27340 = DSM 2950]QMW80616.1 hypothetical protein E5259_25160 [Blautia producta]
MFKNFKKIIFTSLLGVCMIFTTLSPTVVHAQSAETESNEVTVTPNVGVSFVSPEDTIETRGTSRPSKVWNIKTEGQYDFSGSSYHQTLYTNYKFKGKTSYKVYVKNTGKSAITVTAKRLTKTYGSTKISAGKTGSFEFSNIKSDTEFYIVFEAGNEYSFSGYVK